MHSVLRPLQKDQCKAERVFYRVRPDSKVQGRMTASEYLFAVAMTVVIVWLVAEISVAGALKGPRSVRREVISRRK
jgi:hypothetical protein